VSLKHRPSGGSFSIDAAGDAGEARVTGADVPCDRVCPARRIRQIDARLRSDPVPALRGDLTREGTESVADEPGDLGALKHGPTRTVCTIL
jgi:hypothetical protein